MMSRHGQDPAFPVDHEQALVPEVDVKPQRDALNVERPGGQRTTRGWQRACRPLKIVTCERADAALLARPRLRFRVTAGHGFGEYRRAGRQGPEAVAFAPGVLELATNQPFVV